MPRHPPPIGFNIDIDDDNNACFQVNEFQRPSGPFEYPPPVYQTNNGPLTQSGKACGKLSLERLKRKFLMFCKWDLSRLLPFSSPYLSLF